MSDINELQKSFEADFVQELQNKLTELEAENKKLKESILENQLSLGISNEQITCEVQIKLIKDAAVSGRALTMEECRKLEILTNVLSKYKKVVPNETEVTVKKMSDEELLRIAT